MEIDEMLIIVHLKKCIKNGCYFFKSKDISQDIGNEYLTSKKIGALLYRLSKKNFKNFKISKYTESNNRSTWKMEVV